MVVSKIGASFYKERKRHTHTHTQKKGCHHVKDRWPIDHMLLTIAWETLLKEMGTIDWAIGISSLAHL